MLHTHHITHTITCSNHTITSNRAGELEDELVEVELPAGMGGGKGGGGGGDGGGLFIQVGVRLQEHACCSTVCCVVCGGETSNGLHCTTVHLPAT